MGHVHHPFSHAEALASTLDDPDRDAWQQPDDVLRAMELAPTTSVADVGAGTGYFAVRLARAVPLGQVTATDVEPNMVRFVSERARREGLPNLRTSLASPTGSGLAADSFDRILVAHVWHHLSHHVPLARELAAALRPGGRLFVLDFAVSAERGPPVAMRVAPDAITAELEGLGLTTRVTPVAAVGQYLVEARRGS
jgi:arsenite methyltransferase